MLTHVNFIADQFVRAGFNCPAVITILIRPISTVSRLRRNCKYCILVFAVWIWSLAPLIHYGDVGFFAAQNASLIMLHKSRNSSCVRTQMHSSLFACIFSGNLLASSDSTPSSMHRKHTLAQLSVALAGRPVEWGVRQAHPIPSIMPEWQSGVRVPH